MSDPIIDPQAFGELQASAGADFVVELIDTFLEEAPQLLTQMQQALDANNADSFRRAAHSLKANALTFGANHMAQLARELELGGLAPTTALATEYQRVATALTALR